jgi:hypothetical protein
MVGQVSIWGILWDIRLANTVDQSSVAVRFAKWLIELKWCNDERALVHKRSTGRTASGGHGSHNPNGLQTTSSVPADAGVAHTKMRHCNKIHQLNLVRRFKINYTTRANENKLTYFEGATCNTSDGCGVDWRR